MSEPLSLWNQTPTRQAILDFVAAVTKPGSPDLGPLAERIATFDNDGTLWCEKPVNIELHIGRRPLLAFGNSDGDLQMLQWTAAGDGPRFLGLVHHTDAEREWAYRESRIGRLDRALDEAQARGWTVVDMAREWRVVFPWEATS